MPQTAFPSVSSRARAIGRGHSDAPAARQPRSSSFGPSNQILQTKPRIGAVDDPLEREADRVADAVIGGAALPALGEAPAAPQRKCAECEAEEKDTVRRRAADNASAPVSHGGGAEAAAAAVASGGAPLSSDVRSYFEPRFGRDLSDVRVHAGGGAAQAASGIDARAYTLGRNIAFAPGEYAPATHQGRRLIAHELAHVMQQDAARPRIMRQPAPAGATTTGQPSPAGGASTTSSVDWGDATWQADLKTFNDAVKPATGSPDTKKISAAISALVVDVGPSLTIPAGLPTGPKVEPWINATSADPNWTAYTYEHLVFAHPDDAWKWIGINRMAIQQTPGYTRTVLDHELQHASEMHVAAFDYQLINGPPPAIVAGADKPGYTPGQDPYGKYILGFNQYYHSGTTDDRHIEIYAQSAAPNFNRFAPQEKLAWLAQMISTVLPDISRDEALPGEDLVNQVYTNQLPTESEIRNKFADILLSQALRFLDNKDFGRTMTLLDHFTPVWELKPAAFEKVWQTLVLDKQGQK